MSTGDYDWYRDPSIINTDVEPIYHWTPQSQWRITVAGAGGGGTSPTVYQTPQTDSWWQRVRGRVGRENKNEKLWRKQFENIEERSLRDICAQTEAVFQEEVSRLGGMNYILYESADWALTQIQDFMRRVGCATAEVYSFNGIVICMAPVSIESAEEEERQPSDSYIYKVQRKYAIFRKS